MTDTPIIDAKAITATVFRNWLSRKRQKMTDTPIIDAARNAVMGVPHWRLSCDSGDLLNIKVAREIAVTALRAANPREPPAEEIEAMAAAVWDEFHALKRFYQECSDELKADYRQMMLAAYRARPIMRELYDENGLTR